MQLKNCFVFLFLTAAVYGQLPLRQDPNKVVATVDGHDITWSEVQHILSVAPPQLVNFYQADPKGALMQWFVMQHLGKEAEQRKLDQQSPLKEQLEAIRFNYLADARVNEEFNGYPVTQDMIQAAYNKDASRYRRVRVSGVYVKFKPEVKAGATSPEDVAALAEGILAGMGAQRTEAEARALAEDIGKRMRAGEPVAELAAKYSDDPATKEKGGDIGYVTPASEFPGEFRGAALALEVGEVSGPIRLPAGFYVIRADEKGAQPLSQAAPEIIEEIRKQHLDDFLKALNTKYMPVIQDPTLLIPTPQRK